MLASEKLADDSKATSRLATATTAPTQEGTHRLAFGRSSDSPPYSLSFVAFSLALEASNGSC